MWAILGRLIPALVAGVNTSIEGRGRGDGKRAIVLDALRAASRAFVGLGEMASVPSDDELGTAIDVVHGQMKDAGEIDAQVDATPRITHQFTGPEFLEFVRLSGGHVTERKER